MDQLILFFECFAQILILYLIQKTLPLLDHYHLTNFLNVPTFVKLHFQTGRTEAREISQPHCTIWLGKKFVSEILIRCKFSLALLVVLCPLSVLVGTNNYLFLIPGIVGGASGLSNLLFLTDDTGRSKNLLLEKINYFGLAPGWTWGASTPHA